MKNILLIICIGLLSFSIFADGIPHLVFGSVRNVDGSIPNPSDIGWVTHITERENEVIPGGFSFGDPAFYEDGYWTVECSNFPTPWNSGETLKVLFNNYTLEESGFVTIVLNNDSFQEASILFFEPGIGISLENEIISIKRLSYNSPNPFNPQTTIYWQFDESQIENMELDIFNIKGEKVKNFSLNGDNLQTGSIVWNGKNNHEQKVATGIYFYTFTLNSEESFSGKMLLIK